MTLVRHISEVLKARTFMKIILRVLLLTKILNHISFSDLKGFVDVLVSVKIPWNGGPGDIFNGPLLQRITVQFEFPAVAGKDQDPFGG